MGGIGRHACTVEDLSFMSVVTEIRHSVWAFADGAGQSTCLGHRVVLPVVILLYSARKVL
jgi:hypothetical protein